MNTGSLLGLVTAWSVRILLECLEQETSYLGGDNSFVVFSLALGLH